jgi:starch synthase
MHIMFLSPEICPFIRVGGLAEVAHDLPLALGARGHRVEIVAPKCMMPVELEKTLEPMDITLEVPVSWRRHQAAVFKHNLSPEVTVYFISHEHLFDREGLYGNSFGDYEDNAERFIFYSRAALELALALGWDLDVVHANDWTTGLVPLYLKSLYADQPRFSRAGIVMTIHNLGAQGMFWHYDMPLTGLGWEYFTPQGVEFYGKINFLKAGLVFADVITTVSETYAKEILSPDQGHGLEGVLQDRRQDLTAVINGLDYKTWNPETDSFIAAKYSARNLAPKMECRLALQKQMGLAEEPKRPLAAVVGRLLDRKGLDLVAPALEHILDMGLNVVIMGFGEDRYHVLLKSLARKRPERLAVKIGYYLELAHHIMAGADMLLMPSRYEPCGLHQMQALRYGVVPVVRDTGGLADTVQDHGPAGPGTGFKFTDFSQEAMFGALSRALTAYSQPNEWQEVMRRGMAQDFSWDSAAPRYEEIYRRAQSQRGGRQGA